MMQLSRMSLARAFAFLLVIGLGGAAHAQGGDYPSREIKIIVPYAPGGPDDLIGRIVAKKLAELWKQPVVVYNRPGVGGTIGMDAAAKAPPDGYTMAVGDPGQLAIAPGIYAKLPYHPLHDLTPVANVALLPYVLAVNPGVPAKSVQELIELARSRKNPMTYGSTGTGGANDLSVRLFESLAGIKLLQVPYQGAAAYVSALLAGQIDMAITDLSATAPLAKAGKLRLLAATTSKRLGAAPQLPTMVEAGVKGYAVDIWIGIVAPAGTPKSIVSKLNSAIDSALKSADVQQHFHQLGYTAIGGTPEQFAATIAADTAKYGRIIKDANISPR